MRPDQIAQAVRSACLRAANEAYEDAAIQGLCTEGRWEAAIGAIQSLDFHQVVQELEQATKTSV